MKRRTFLKSTISTSSIMLSGGLLANNIIDHVFNQQDVSDEELKSILHDHIDKIFKGDYFDVNMLPTEGIIRVSDSFELKMVEDKNTIFDIADLVIKETAKYGFDSHVLLEGKIPSGLNLYYGLISIRIPEASVGIKIPELKNYDAIIIYHNPTTIKYKVPIQEWAEEKKFDLFSSNEVHDYYVDRKTRVRISNQKKDTEIAIKVDSINPLIINNNESLNIFYIDKKIMRQYFSKEIYKLIL